MHVSNIRCARVQVDPNHQRTIGVLTKCDLMDKGTNARDVLENRKYPLSMGWVGVVNRSQMDIEGKKTLSSAFEAEKKFFRMGDSPYKDLKNTSTQILSDTLSEQLIRTIRNKLPGLQSSINTNISALNKELYDLGDDVPEGRGAMIHAIIDACNKVQEAYKNMLQSGRGGGERILQVRALLSQRILCWLASGSGIYLVPGPCAACLVLK